MPEKAKVFIVEDDPGYREALSDCLEMFGHTVVAVGVSLEDGLAKIDEIEEVDVGLFDGNLSRMSEGGTDGEQVATKFRQRFPGKKVYAISADKLPWSDDPNLTKRSMKAIAEKVTVC